MKKSILKFRHIWLLIPAVPFFAQVLLSARNVPKEDDYDAILGWLINFKQSTFEGKELMMFDQNNEHRILFSHIIYLLYDFVCGGINFRNLIIIGDLQLLGCAIILCYFSLKYLGPFKEWIAFIWMIVLFDGCGYENANWAMAAIQNYGVVFLFLLSLFFYERNLWPVAVIVQAVLIFSNGNGIIGAIALSAFAIQRSKIDGFKSRRLDNAWSFSCVVTILFGYVYFQDYITPLPLPGQFPISVSKAIDFFIQNVGTYWSFECAFIFGFLLLIALLNVYPYRNVKSNFIWISILLFVFGSMIAVAVFRGSITGAKYEQSRYLIYPEIITAMIVLFMSNKLRKNPRGYVVMIFATVLVLRNYALNYQQDNEKEFDSQWTLEVRKYQYHHSHGPIIDLATFRIDSASKHADSLHCDKIIRDAEEMGIYSLDDGRLK